MPRDLPQWIVRLAALFWETSDYQEWVQLKHRLMVCGVPPSALDHDGPPDRPTAIRVNTEATGTMRAHIRWTANDQPDILGALDDLAHLLELRSTDS